MDVVTQEHKLTYNNNVQLAVQQKTSRFEMAFTYAPDLKGRKAQILDLIGTTSAIVDGPRGGDTPNIDNQTEPVWVAPHSIEWGKLIEKEDQIKALTDYQSPFVQSGAAAIVRGRDAVFSTAIFAPRLIGQDGATSQAWDSTNRTVATTVGASTGMCVAKIQRAKRLLAAQEVDTDQEELWGVLNAQQMEELYNDILTINTDFAKMAVIEHDTKMVKRLGNVNWVRYEKMTDFDGATYAGGMWAKSGMYYGDFSPLETKAEPNPQKKYRIQPYMENWWGATRGEDEKVVKILTTK